MSKVCDHKSVGVIITNEQGAILLIERKKYPFGFAPPAGHVDEFLSPEDCARGEVFEEVGLTVDSLTLLWEGEKHNSCRREDGTRHYWWVYQATVTGEIERSEEETKQVGWHTSQEVQELLQKTQAYKEQSLSDVQWEQSPGIELVWADLFEDSNLT